MSLKVTTWVWEQSQEKSTGRLLLLALADYCNDEGMCYPSVGTLAAKCRLTQRRIRQLLNSLQKAGVLEIINEQGHRCRCRSGTNRYYLNAYRCSIGLPPVTETGAAGCLPPADNLPLAPGTGDLPGADNAGSSSTAAVTPESEIQSTKPTLDFPAEAEIEGLKSEIQSTKPTLDFTPGAEIQGPQSEIQGKKPTLDFSQTVINRHKNPPTHTPPRLPRAGAFAGPAGVCADEGETFEKKAWDWAAQHSFWSTRITCLEALLSNLAEDRAFRAQFLAAQAKVTPDRQRRLPEPAVPQRPPAHRSRRADPDTARDHLQQLRHLLRGGPLRYGRAIPTENTP